MRSRISKWTFTNILIPCVSPFALLSDVLVSSSRYMPESVSGTLVSTGATTEAPKPVQTEFPAQTSQSAVSVPMERVPTVSPATEEPGKYFLDVEGGVLASKVATGPSFGWQLRGELNTFCDVGTSFKRAIHSIDSQYATGTMIVTSLEGTNRLYLTKNKSYQVYSVMSLGIAATAIRIESKNRQVGVSLTTSETLPTGSLGVGLGLGNFYLESATRVILPDLDAKISDNTALSVSLGYSWKF